MIQLDLIVLRTLGFLGILVELEERPTAVPLKLEAVSLRLA